MKILNNYQIPDAIYRACCKYIRRPEKDRFSVTELISPPQFRYLKMKHWDELQEDVSARLWALLGSAVHSIVSQHAIDESLSEEKLEMIYNYQGQNYTIKGVPDLLIDDELIDIKVTSVWSFLLGEKQEWENQLNLYALLYKHYKFDVNKICIWAILRDWDVNKVQKNGKYPPIPFMKVNIKLWTDEEQKKFLEKCIKDHLQEPPRPCSPEEQWTRFTTVAATKKGCKTANRNQKKEEIKVRCRKYCIVSPFCEQFQKEEQLKREANKDEIIDE